MSSLENVDTMADGMYNTVRFCPGSFANSQGDCLCNPPSFPPGRRRLQGSRRHRGEVNDWREK
jgi:hypothetical protein